MKGLHHIALLASHKARTVRFYEALGFRVTACHPRPERQDEIVMMTGGGVTLEIFVSSGNPPRVTSPEAYGLRHLALRTDDAQALRERLCRAGYDPEEMRRDSFTGENMFFVKDPDGLPVEFHE